MNKKTEIRREEIVPETSRKHKFTKNDTYFTISVYAVITVCIAVVLVKAIWNWAETLKTFDKIVDMLMPFLIGLLIAYMMNPLVKVMDKMIFEKLFRIKSKSVRKALSILV